ncbi:ABC transporter ATP-binding protein [Roseibium sp. CAU 1637]|uniref:ABC transporter ATP-binding protein n=1 Tax=Roseibium limicola TaxID=2816037 RepID=A0A939J5A3_9HYPH|nr:ABC transporter ATP-binding protein [Roseibium limicola]MBO0343867.1 ABC transporter ATP-binding protein [Roseibium limicola]
MLYYFITQARWAFVLMLVLGGVTAAVETSLYVFLGWIVDLIATADREGFFVTHWRLLAGMAFVIIVLRTLATSLTALVEEQTAVPHFINLVRWQSHQQVMRQSISYFQNDFSGRLAQKVTQSGMAANEFMVNLLQTVWFILIYALSALVLLGQLDVGIAVLVAAWLVTVSAIAWYFVPRVRLAAKATANAASGVSGHLVDTYTNIQSVKLFGSRRGEDSGARAAFENSIGKTRVFTRLLTSVRSLMSFVSGTMMVLIGGSALYYWQAGALTTGDVAFTLGLVFRLAMLLNRLLGQLNGLFRNIGTFQDSMETVIKPIAVQDQPGAPELKVATGAISFGNVGFHYGKKGGVIDDLSLEIAPGERIGLIGPSGAGKSTLVNLLLRFYDVEHGRIKIDGVDIREVTQESLRRQIGMVTQDTSLMHRSIRENIGYGRPGASEEEIVEAARRTQALRFIEGLEDVQGRKALEAKVGERGVKLSGGQRQRIAIARVLLKNAPVLVLDEATSALDSEVEAVIQENLLELMEGKTVIAIAHRLSTISRLDRLVVMEDGRIVQTGTHDELLQQAGSLYARLWQRQSGGFLAVDQMTGGPGG